MTAVSQTDSHGSSNSPVSTDSPPDSSISPDLSDWPDSLEYSRMIRRENMRKKSFRRAQGDFFISPQETGNILIGFFDQTFWNVHCTT